FVNIVNASESDSRGALIRAGISVRVLDKAGVPIAGLEPIVEVIAGDGQVTRVGSRDQTYPGLWDVDVRLGPSAGPNTFRVRAGGISSDVTITGQ
ncbi:MAG: hypothetical protein ACRD44_16260, partial [Bryobacteraceae bacterium]